MQKSPHGQALRQITSLVYFSPTFVGRERERPLDLSLCPLPGVLCDVYKMGAGRNKADLHEHCEILLRSCELRPEIRLGSLGSTLISVALSIILSLGYRLDCGMIVSARVEHSNPPRDFHKKVANLRLCWALDRQTTAGTRRSCLSITP